MSNQIAVPEHLKNNAEAAARALQDAASMASSSNSVPRISLRGREFRLVEGGEEVRKIRDRMRGIILGVEPEAGRMIKTWYQDGYKSGAKEPPTCASDDGVSPSPWIQNKQAQFCAKCPKNQFGSAISPSGKQTKACRDSKRIWLVEAETQDGTDADGKLKWKPITTPIRDRVTYGLNVTVASLKAFSEHGRTLASYGQAPCVAITEFEMLDMEYPQLDFHLVGWVDADAAPVTLAIATERPWKINYGNAGMALGMSEDASAAKLPLSLPAHLQPKTVDASVQEVSVQPNQSEKVSKNQIDDAVGNW